MTDHVGLVVAQLPLRSGRLRCWHFAAFGALAAAAANVWIGTDAAGLVALAYRARFTSIVPPTRLAVRGGLRLWMSKRLVVVSERGPKYWSVYADELQHIDYVRLRRLLRYASSAPAGERLPPLDFALV